MSVDKVILRAVLSTLMAIGVLLVFMILSLCIAFPSTMMKITHDLGMDSSSIHFAERAYDGGEDIYYIAYATEVAIEDDKRDKIISCGERFIADDEFDRYCGGRGENYGQFIYGQVSVAKYEAGAKTEAVELAYDSLNGRFPKNNAVIAMIVAAKGRGDSETLSLIANKLSVMEIADAAEQAELARALAYISK